MRRFACYATPVLVAATIWGVPAASATLTPGWLCIPTTAGGTVISGGTAAAPSCSSGYTAVLAPTYVASGIGGKPTVQFSGLNVQVVSGSGSTAGSVNGMGNLVVGYAENPDGLVQTGSNNLIVGSDDGWDGYGSLIAGYGNHFVGDYESGFTSTAGTDSSLTPNTPSINFGSSVPVGMLSGAASVTITDSGSGTVQLGQVQLTGVNPRDFIVTGDSCSGAILSTGRNCTVTVRVGPMQTGTLTASLAVASDGADSPLEIPLSAVGASAPTGSGSVGPEGPAGPAGPSGPAGPAGKRGQVKIVDCTTVKTANHKSKTKCTTRIASGTVTLTTTHTNVSRRGVKTIRRETVSIG